MSAKEANQTRAKAVREKGTVPGGGQNGDTAGPGAAKSATEEEIAALAGDLRALDFGVHKSLRYHAKRRSFFDFLHRGTMAVAAIGGSGAFASLLGGENETAKWAALTLTIAAALDVVIGYAQWARHHEHLYRSFSDLAAEITTKSSPSDEEIRQWRARRITIEKEESTQISALNIKCHNEEAEARGYPRHRLFPWQAAFCQLITLPPNRFPIIE